MRRWLAPLFAFALLVAPASCGEADQVELRLFPCEFDGLEPRAVIVELTGFDAQGEQVEIFEVAFDDIAASVFDDGFATVGYRKDPQVVRARVRLGWFSTPTAGSFAEAEAIAVYEDVVVPALGEVMTVGSVVDCSELAGDGDGDPSGDGDGAPGDGDGAPGDGDGSPGDGDGAPGDGDGTPGDGDGAPGDGDGSPGDGDGSPGDGDGSPEELPQPGDACDSFTQPFHCVPSQDEQAGVPLFCNPGTDQLEATDVFGSVVCDDSLCPPDSANPIDGCGGFGYPAVCLCEPSVPESCAGATLGCVGPNLLKLCSGGAVVVAGCNNCSMTPGGYYACTR